MNIDLWRGILRWRWLLVTIIGLIIIIFELLEHQPQGTDALDFDFWREILIFSVALPLLLGLVLTRLNQVKPVWLQISDLFNSSSQPPAKERILVIENQYLLGASVENLLQRHAALTVRGITPTSEKELIAEIQNFQPTTIILPEEAVSLNYSIKLLTLLKSLKELRFVIVNINDNLIFVYPRKSVLLENGAELINLMGITKKEG